MSRATQRDRPHPPPHLPPSSSTTTHTHVHSPHAMHHSTTATRLARLTDNTLLFFTVASRATPVGSRAYTDRAFPSPAHRCCSRAVALRARIAHAAFAPLLFLRVAAPPSRPRLPAQHDFRLAPSPFAALHASGADTEPGTNSRWSGRSALDPCCVQLRRVARRSHARLSCATFLLSRSRSRRTALLFVSTGPFFFCHGPSLLELHIDIRSPPHHTLSPAPPPRVEAKLNPNNIPTVAA